MTASAEEEAATMVAAVRDDPARRLFLSLHNILPVRYPLDGITVPEILAAENYGGRLVDYGVILPRAAALYVHVAAELNEPGLLEMVRDGWPVYAWPYAERHVWRPVKAPRVIRTLRRLTGPYPALRAGPR